MKALGGSYLRVFVSREREKERGTKSSRNGLGFHVHQKRLAADGLVLFRAKCASSVSTAAPIFENSLETKEIQTLNSEEPNTVRVRFKLHKACAFGQHFLVVGDDPNLGLWDPSDGVPLDWSEGHLWTAEVDMPSSKVVNYKFILKELSGAVHWQPGPDRVLETWDTAKTISVSEDWDSPELQNIVEEEVVVTNDVNELSLENSDSLIAENLNRVVVEEWDDANECMNHHSGNPTSIGENIQDLSLRNEVPDLMSVAEKGVIVINGNNSSSLKNETCPSVDEGVPVLVPGLGTVPYEKFESEELKMEENSSMVECDENLEVITTNSFDEIEDPIGLNQKDSYIVEDSVTEFEETETASLHYAEASEVVVDEEEEEEERPRFNGEEKKMGRNIFHSNIQWVRQRLHQFLANLGFMRQS